jgi:hypothetical protein
MPGTVLLAGLDRGDLASRARLLSHAGPRMHRPRPGVDAGEHAAEPCNGMTPYQ